MRQVFWTLAALAGLGLVGAAAVVVFGLYNVSARAGHLPGVSWVLHTTFRNAVALRAPDPETAPDFTPAMVALGARHYDSACTACHAAPDRQASATMQSMVPHPPHVTDAVGDWDAGELHWILHNGVKMSGMPHWPSIRADDVWPVVAFLREVRGLSGADYRRLTARPAAPAGAPPGLEYCAMCHGLDGVSGNPHIPRLDILGEEALLTALQTYRAGTRESGIMAQAATMVPEAALPGLARWYARNRPETPPAPLPTSALVDEGRALALARRGDDDVPACSACHGPARDPERRPGPEIRGQYAPYIATQLRLWRDGKRGGGHKAPLMQRAAAELTDPKIEALAAFYAAGAPGAGE